jgi:hypothetical protein
MKRMHNVTHGITASVAARPHGNSNNEKSTGFVL